MREVDEPFAARKAVEMTADPIAFAATNPITLQGLRKTSIIRRLLESWPRLVDPRNFVGMGLLNASEALNLVRRIRRVFQPS